MEFLSVTWKDLHLSSFNLSQQIKKGGNKPDLIVAIARGGITIAHILSDFLRLPVSTFTISSYKDLKQHTIPEIKFKLGESLHNKHILLVDDVSDSGKTFVRGIEYLQELKAKTIQTASLFIKPQTCFVPNFYVKKTKKWIIFPYDMRETVEAVTKIMKREHSSQDTLKVELKKLRIPSVFIEHYLEL